MLNEPVPKSHYGESAFSYSGPHEWNKLPYSIKACTSLDAFKSALKTHFFKLSYDIN